MLVWALPSARALELSTPWSGASDEIELVAPTDQATPIALASSRSVAPEQASNPIGREPSSAATLSAPRFGVAAAHPASNGVARWILGRTSTSAIP